MSVLQVSTAHQLTPRPALEPFQLAQTDAKKRRLMLLADYVHPFVYRTGFPQGVPDVDMVLAAGDLPGYYLEYLATKLPVPVLYVPGNHENEYINEGDGRIPARGVTNIHGKVLTVAGLRVADARFGSDEYLHRPMVARIRSSNYRCTTPNCRCGCRNLEIGRAHV